MIQKKVCMVGASGAGKTSLVRQFVFSKFSEKYHSTVGVKIDRKQVDADGTPVHLLLWDLEGRDESQELHTSYLRGSSGLIYVVDGTRKETLAQLFELHALATDAIGDVPSIVALNKVDLQDRWQIGADEIAALDEQAWHRFTTSAKTGVGVEDAFRRLTRTMLGGRPA